MAGVFMVYFPGHFRNGGPKKSKQLELDQSEGRKSDIENLKWLSDLKTHKHDEWQQPLFSHGSILQKVIGPFWGKINLKAKQSVLALA